MVCRVDRRSSVSRPRLQTFIPRGARTVERDLFRRWQLHRNVRRVADDARRAIGIVAAVAPEERFEDQHELLGEHI